MKLLVARVRFSLFCAVILSSFFLFGCNIVKKEKKTAVLLKADSASQSQLIEEVNRFARVSSMKAKMDLRFEDNSFAEFGSKEAYRDAPGEIVVQRPANIRMTVSLPFVGGDVAQMTSNGETFRVAILNDGGSGKYKKFVKGTNRADYSKLQKTLTTSANGDGRAKVAKENVNAFANLRPQHFTDAMLVRPVDDTHLYTQSTIYQVEEDTTTDSKSPTRMVNRPYYLLDEFEKLPDSGLKISRRFWFDRVGAIRLARQQIFDEKGEIESDIVYGMEGSLTDTGNFARLPLQIQVTRPKDHYSMRLTYQSPMGVVIGKTFPDTAFVLQNTWNLEEVDLDQKLRDAVNKPASLLNLNTANQNKQ